MVSQGSQEYTAAGTYTFNVPTGVSCVSVTAVAAGAGGATSILGGTDFQGEGAGGAGESVEGMLLKCTPSGTIAVTVGAGGLKGDWSTGFNATNVHAGPPGNTAAGAAGNHNATATSLDTTVGAITCRGGYGGIQNGSAPHGGIGGGWGATTQAGATGVGLGNNGEAGNPGVPARKKNSNRHMSGSGGGGGSLTVPGHGGPFGPWDGGAAGSNSSPCGGGAGGGASLYGSGSAGGNAIGGNAAAVGSTAYGAGGGAGGGTNVGGAKANAGLGADGKDGYVLLTWFAVT